MATGAVSPKEFGRRFRKALSVPFLLQQVCSLNTQEFITSYSESLGCTEKCLFFPLLSCIASCMGTDCHVQLTTHWMEPPIIWTLVITARSLMRIDVAEHLKQLLLKAQNEVWVIGQNEDTKDHLKKFLFDSVTLSQLQDILKLSNGHGLAIYNSVRSLNANMQLPEQLDIMQRMLSGLSWFCDSRVTKTTVTKTRVNFAVISTPTCVQQTLASAPNFQELLHQSFLATCSEEFHVKFSQITNTVDSNKLREIFTSLLKLHFAKGPIIYKLSEEAQEKFSQIHDELTDKAKQMARKNAHKVFQPALAYLGRLSCVLHVLDNVIYAVSYAVPISHLTWNTEISAETVWYARELLGHIIEQRHALMEQTMIETGQQKVVNTPPIQIVDGQPPQQRTPQMYSPRNNVGGTPPINRNAVQSRFSFNNSARRNILNNSTRTTPPRPYSIPVNNSSNNPTPIIESVCSLPVEQVSTFNPIITSCDNVSNALNTELNLPPALSISVSEDAEDVTPVLLSRSFTSILEISKEDFLKSHRSSIKKLLKHSTGEISPSRCTQLKLTPDPTASDETQKYTLAFARSFLKRLESMGFGICEGAKNGNLRHFIFKKKKFSALGAEQKEILTELNISEVEYNKCFLKGDKPQNGAVVCLE